MPLKSGLLCTLTFCLAVIAAFSSCSHGGSSDPGNPVNNSYLSSVRSLEPGVVTIDSFTYDAQHKVARYEQFDEEDGQEYHFTAEFSFTGSNTLPDSYVATVNGGTADTHQLTFDGQGRIIKDTSLSGSHFVTYFIYSGNYIIGSTLFDGTLNNALIDTLTIKDGNITGERVWVADNGPLAYQGATTLGHSTAANPGYKPEIANTVGPLLAMLSINNYGGYTDFLSKTVMNKVTGDVEGLPPGGLSYSVSADGQGRVSSVTPHGTDVPDGVKTVFTYY
jgi:hypothetical protein